MNRKRRHICLGIAPAFVLIVAVALAYGADGDNWIEVRSPHFIVVSNAGEAEARKVAVQFEQIRSVFRESLSFVRTQNSHIVTVLAVRDEDSLRELIPEYWTTKGSLHPSGVFIQDGLRFQAAINLGSQGGNPYEAIYHEYYHSVTAPYFPDLPLWVSEGLAEFYGHTKFGADAARPGMPTVALIQAVRRGKLIPLDTLFKIDKNSPYYHEEKRASIFYAESWALVHYLLLADHQSHQQDFRTYLQDQSGGATQEEAAAKAFGNLKKLQSQLERYVAGVSFSSLIVPLPAGLDPSELHVRQLSDADADAYRGGFLTVHGKFEQAQTRLEEAVKLDPQSALARENLAVLYYFQKRPQAFAALSAAIALDPRNALTRFLRANVASEAGWAVAPPGVEEDLRAAIAADPNFAPAYALLASSRAAKNQKLDEALTLARQAVALAPGNADYEIIVAQVLAHMGQLDQAEALGRQVARSFPSNPRRQQLVGQLLDYIGRQRGAASAGR